MAAIPERFANQEYSIHYFEDRPRGLDFSDPGTGKTRVQIDLFKRRATGKCMLVLAPKTLLESAWAADIRKFAPDLEVSVAYAQNRQKAFDQKADIYITNTDATRWLVKQKPAFFRRFDTLVIDEISGFKHRTSLRSRCLRKIVRHFKYRYGLTGTPDSNTILDVWHQALVIDDGERLGRSFGAFRTAVAYPIQVGPEARMVKWEDKPGARMVVADRLSEIVVRHELDECQDIPENHVYEVPFTLSRTHMDAYNSMEQNAVLALRSGEVVSAVNAAALITKLLQIASGSVYGEQGSVVRIEDDRYRLIIDLIEARDHSLVFFNWKHQVECLIELCKANDITWCRLDGETPAKERARIVNEYQMGSYRVCFAQPQSAAHGITLTRARSTIWASPTYNLEHFTQGNRRIYRAGQRHKTETVLVTAKNTIESRVYQRLLDKQSKQVNFLELIRTLSR